MTIKKWNLGETIQILRQRLRLTKSRFAQLIGVNPITIARWEKGQGAEKMKLKHLFRISKVTSIKTSELIEACENNQSDPSPKNDSPLHCEPEALFLSDSFDATTKGNGKCTSEMEGKNYGKHRT